MPTRPIEKYLEDVKIKAGIKTDRELATKLGVKPQAISAIKSGFNTPSEEHCKKLADLAKDPYEKVLLLAQVSKASETSKGAWERILKATAKAGIFTLGLVLVYLMKDQSSDALTTLPLIGSFVSSRGLDIMSNVVPFLALVPVLLYSLRKSLETPKLSL